MSKKKLIRSTGIIGVATSVSKVLGFVRDLIIAHLFGTTMAAQAFIVVFRLPNMFRMLVGEGASNAALVPILTEYYTTREKDEYLGLLRALFIISFFILLTIAVLGVIASPVIVRLIAPGFIREPEKLRLAIQLNRIVFPYLFFIGFTAFFMGALNSQGHFTAPAYGPSLLNLSLILSAVLLSPSLGIFSLAIGVIIGGLLQFSLNFIALYRRGSTFTFRSGCTHPAIPKIGRLLVPRFFGAAVYQVNVFIDTILASLSWIVGAGGVAGLYYANRMIQFPLSIFGEALAQAALPKMSQEASQGNLDQLKETLLFALKTGFFIMIPATFGYIVLREPIIRTLFERGQFDAYSTSITENALLFYSFGLFAYCGIKILVNTFFALHDTVTPVKVAVISVCMNVTLNLILMWPMKLGGLALATSLSGITQFLILFHLLRKKIRGPGIAEVAEPFLRITGASVVMAIVCRVMLLCCAIGSEYSSLHNYIQLSMVIAAGVSAFLVAALLLGVQEIKGFLTWAFRRR